MAWWQVRALDFPSGFLWPLPGGTGRGLDYQHGENQAALGVWGGGILGAISHLTFVAFGFLLYEWVGLGSDELQNVSLFGGC